MAAASQSSSQTVASTGNSSSSNSSSSDTSYQGATTTPVTATESGECIGTFTITAYCGCSKCSGGSNKTASGTTPTEGRTIAADTSILPYGTQVVIDGIVYTVEDCGSGVSGNHIDIFFATHEKAVSYGRKTVKVYKY
jgi:3D (Asp-Asp-Asp) domain-containing protein